jgi:stringent starvation protein B
MPLEKLQNREFQDIMQEHILNTIEFLFDNNQEFAVACEIEYITFTPTLPEDIQRSMPIVTLFMLANYSFESATIDNEYLRFEAGFGNENIGSLVQIPILAIKHIYVEEYPILINITSPSDDIEEEEEEVDSMSALLNNPENAKLLKKKR